MKYNHYFFIMVHFLTVATFSCAMEKENKWHITQEITDDIKNPRCVRYIGKDRIVGGGSNCDTIILDLKTKETQKISSLCHWEKPSVSLLQYHQGKIVFTHHRTAKIHDAQTGQAENFLTIDAHIQSFVYCPDQNCLIIGYNKGKGGITKYNYVTSTIEEISIYGRFCEGMAIHPNKKTMCIKTDEAISLYNLSDLKNKIKTLQAYSIGGHICQYSPDGSYIVTGNGTHLFIIDPDKNNKIFPFLAAATDESFKNIAFHPKGSVLATLSQRQTTKENLSAPFFLQQSVHKSQVVRFWDLKTQKCIYTMPVFNVQDGYDLTFSEDGLEMVIVLEDTCVRVLVPFEVQKKCTYFLWALHQIAKESNLPDDAVHHCSKILWETIKF